MQKVNQVDDKTKLTQVHHEICDAVSAFSRLSARVPKVSIEIVQHIYGRFDDALYHIYEAERTHDKSEKETNLHFAKDCLFFQYTSLEMLVANRSITVGQANEVIVLLKRAYISTSKWLNSVVHNG